MNDVVYDVEIWLHLHCTTQNAQCDYDAVADARARSRRAFLLLIVVVADRLLFTEEEHARHETTRSLLAALFLAVHA